MAEKTAILQDAQLDWRKSIKPGIIPDCAAGFRWAEMKSGPLDWDGVNLAELYFESLEGAANPARPPPHAHGTRMPAMNFMPHNFDPIELFKSQPDDKVLRIFSTTVPSSRAASRKNGIG